MNKYAHWGMSVFLLSGFAFYISEKAIISAILSLIGGVLILPALLPKIEQIIKRKVELTHIVLVCIAFFALTVLASPQALKDKLAKKENKGQEKPVTEKNYPDEKSPQVKSNKNRVDNNIFKVNIKESDLHFEVTIDSIVIKEIENYFTVPPEEKYTKTTYRHGYQMYVFFKIRNPYDKEYIGIPIDSYFKIYGGENEKGFKDYSNVEEHRTTRYDWGNTEYYFSSYLLDRNGNKVPTSSRLSTEVTEDFKAKEAKEFSMRFEPFGESISEVHLKGFHSKYESYSPRELIDLVIDPKTRKIVKIAFSQIK